MEFTTIFFFLIATIATILAVFTYATSNATRALAALRSTCPVAVATATPTTTANINAHLEIDLELGPEYVVVPLNDDTSDCGSDTYTLVNELMNYELHFDRKALDFADDIEQDDSFGLTTVVMGLQPVAASNSIGITTANCDSAARDGPNTAMIATEAEHEATVAFVEQEAEDAIMTSDLEQQSLLSMMTGENDTPDVIAKDNAEQGAPIEADAPANDDEPEAVSMVDNLEQAEQLIVESDENDTKTTADNSAVTKAHDENNNAVETIPEKIDRNNLDATEIDNDSAIVSVGDAKQGNEAATMAGNPYHQHQTTMVDDNDNEFFVEDNADKYAQDDTDTLVDEGEDPEATLTADNSQQTEQATIAPVNNEAEVTNVTADISEAHDNHGADTDMIGEVVDNGGIIDASTSNSDLAQDSDAEADAVTLIGASEHILDNVVSLSDHDATDLDKVEFGEHNNSDISTKVESTTSMDSIEGEEVDSDSNEAVCTASDCSESSSMTASLSPRSETSLSGEDGNDSELPVAEEDDDNDEPAVRVVKSSETSIVRALDQFDWNGKSHLILDDSDEEGEDESDDNNEDGDDGESNDDDEDDGLVLQPRAGSQKAQPRTLVCKAILSLSWGAKPWKTVSRHR